ncbi:hypothetical protein LTR53_004053 [Teratosphaeriaceae sp. CCFEE 6253]|nr:hypothetical protein LTR53_004053 [Teratosphaeriaceae sp. CCFEE 6253]
MLSRNIKRALLDSRWPTPPTFLLPWAATLTTVSQATDTNAIPPPLANAGPHPPRARSQHKTPLSSASPPPPVPQLPAATAAAPPPALSDSVRELLPVLAAQGPHYIAAHLYDRPYLVTAGDTVRLPFLMKGVEPGDVLRLNRASVLGSREYTLKAAAAGPKLKSPTMSSTSVLDPTSGSLASHSTVMSAPSTLLPGAVGRSALAAPHFVPHIAQGKVAYLDERLFVCRAVVMGVESEPLRIKEKTKRRQRKVKKVKSKHQYTILRIKEVSVRGVGELESGVEV